MISRRSFLGTIASAIAVGFAKVETAVLERPGPLVTDAFYGGAAGGGKSEWMFQGIPFYCDDTIRPGCYMGISRDIFRLDPYVDVNASFPPRAFEGASGDPTSDS